MAVFHKYTELIFLVEEASQRRISVIDFVSQLYAVSSILLLLVRKRTAIKGISYYK